MTFAFGEGKVETERKSRSFPPRSERLLLALTILLAAFVASLCLVLKTPTAVYAAGQAEQPIPASSSSAPGVVKAPAPVPAQTGTTPPVSAIAPVRPHRSELSSRNAVPAPVSPQTAAPVSVADPQADASLNQSQMELDGALDELNQSRENLAQASAAQRRILIAGAIFLVAIVLITVAAMVLFFVQVRRWNKRSLESVRHVEEIAAQLKPLTDATGAVRDALPRLLQEVGEQPLGFEEVGTPFAPKALTVLDDIDHLAYLGDAQLFFGKLSSPSEMAVYLNGLLLSGVAQLARFEPWAAFARLDRFFDLLTRYPEAVDRHRIAQGCSYRALAAYQALDAQDREPSWLRKSERSQLESLSKQAFSDIAQASRLDPEWKHAIFVEALLCSRFYVSDDPAESSSRSELYVRGLRRAVALYKGLIEERRYRGPARYNLARCLKRIAEQTGDKGDFSDFGYALSAFPSDEELAEECLASRQPASQDRFLWQWMLGDAELFHTVDRLNVAEYRSFWIRLLDNKVHLRNWRADLGELQQRDPAMRNWSIQLLHSDSPISLANAGARRQERFESPSSGT